MSSVVEVEEFAHPRATEAETVPWIAVLFGLAALYVPVYLDLARGAWREDAHAHGPIVLAIFAWLVWRKRRALLVPTRPAPLAGGALVIAGLALYIVGRGLAIASIEAASHIPVIAGAVLAVRGRPGLRLLAMPICFLAFLVPLPSFVLEAITSPLKEGVSAAVQGLLSLLGYSVDRAGVVLSVGGHELLVADACSGLNSIYSLFAMSLIYSQLVGPRNPARIAALLAAVVPIAIATNIVRVAVLALVTVRYGEQAATGIVHSLAGMVAFGAALVLVTQADAWLRPLVSPDKPRMEWKLRTTKVLLPAFARVRPIAIMASGFAMAFLMIGAAVMVPVLKPRAVEGAPDFEALLPARFGDWRIDPSLVQIPPSPDVQASLDRVYDQVVARTYVNSRGDHVMVMLAYGGEQSDALKSHRQEGCYASQGFRIHNLHVVNAHLGGRVVPVTRMHAVRGERSEPVTYWLTMGDRVVTSRLQRLRVQLAEGWAGRMPDGVLVRVSSLSDDAPRAYALHREFLAAALASVPAEQRWRFVGSRQLS